MVLCNSGEVTLCPWPAISTVLLLKNSAPLRWKRSNNLYIQRGGRFPEISKFSLYFRVFSELRPARVNYSRVSNLSRERWIRSMVIPRPPSVESWQTSSLRCRRVKGPQQFPKFLCQYQPTDVPRRLAHLKRSVGSRSPSDSQTPHAPEVLTRVTFVPRLLLAGDETRLLIINFGTRADVMTRPNFAVLPLIPYLFSLPILKSHSNCRYLREISLLSSNQIAISHFSPVAVK